MFSNLRSALKDVIVTARDVVQEKANSIKESSDNDVAGLNGTVIQVGDKSVRITRTLGEGGFSFVYAAEDIVTHTTYALKRVLINDKDSNELVDNELAVMKSLSGKLHIIQYLGSTRIRRNNIIEIYILMEYAQLGTLHTYLEQHLRERTFLQEKEVYEMFIQVVTAVSHLHLATPPTVHRDLKIEQVLLQPPQRSNAADRKGRVAVPLCKLCDFGSCSTVIRAYESRSEIVVEEERIAKHSTLSYRAPEMCDLYRRQVIGLPIDIWALGCILCTLAYLHQPFADTGQLAIINGTYTIPDHPAYSKYLTLMIKRCLQPSPEKRPTIQQLMQMCDKWQVHLYASKSKSKPSTNSANGSRPSQISTSRLDAASPAPSDDEFINAVNSPQPPAEVSNDAHTASQPPPADDFGSWDPFAGSTISSNASTDATPQLPPKVRTQSNSSTHSNTASMNQPPKSRQASATMQLFDIPAEQHNDAANKGHDRQAAAESDSSDSEWSEPVSASNTSPTNKQASNGMHRSASSGQQSFGGPTAAPKLTGKLPPPIPARFRKAQSDGTATQQTSADSREVSLHDLLNGKAKDAETNDNNFSDFFHTPAK